MGKSLENLVKVAGEAYTDHFLLKEAQKSGPPESARVELAHFIVQQMKDLYDPDSSDERNIKRILSGLEHAREDIAGVMAQLDKLLKP